MAASWTSTSSAHSAPSAVGLAGLFHPFRHVPLEIVDLGLLSAESTPFPRSRVGAFLRSFTDGPVLAIDQVPEVHRVAGVEAWLHHHIRIEVPIAFNRGMGLASGPESMDHEI